MQELDSFGAALLKAATRKVFPKVCNVHSDLHSRGFMVTFTDDAPFQQSYLPLLEEAMGQLLQEPVDLMEMVSGNAKELLAHHNQLPQKPLEEGIVFVVKIGPFFEVAPNEPKLGNVFSLLEVIQEGKQVTLYGKAFENHLEKQRFEKKYRKWISHEKIAKEIALYEGEVWHPRGMLFRQCIETLKKNLLQSFGFVSIDTPDPLNYFQTHKLSTFTCREVQFCFGEPSILRAFELVQTWATMFDLKWRWVQRGHKYKKDLQIEDTLGCDQTLATFQPVKGGARFSFSPDLYKWILEKEGKDLPLWLAPEQVRLLTPSDMDTTQVTEIFRIANIRYTVDRRECPLKEKIYQALRVNVPYVMIFGKQEETANQMTIRASRSKKGETIYLTELKQFFSERNFESR